MKNDEFVEKLRCLAPTKNELLKKGLSEKFISELIESYICLPKEGKHSNIASDDQLLNLIDKYDCSKVVVGLIEFNYELIENYDHYVIGRVEADVLVINKITKEIEVLEAERPGHRIWRCAANGNRFLDALLDCVYFFSRRMVDKTLIENRTFTSEMAIKSSGAAGGEFYFDFYAMLLSVD